MGKRSRSKKLGPTHRPLNQAALRGIALSEVGPDGNSYQVQQVGPSSKTYTCPGCLHQVGPGVEHVVAWPEDGAFGTEIGVGARRHWHGECWRRGLRPN